MAIHELFPYLCVDDAGAAIDFYCKVFEVKEIFRLVEPSGRIAVTLHLHVDDADAVVARAVAAGATLDMAPQDQFYGERSGVFHDPFGHRWNVGHSIEKLTPEEMQRRYTAMFDSAG
jgi:uncharacterized glyoxalase superfamily protein PhnB